MDISKVKYSIVNKCPEPLYLFTGIEIAVQNIYINKIAECCNLEVIRCESISDIFGKLKNKSFVNKNYCYVIRDDKEFITNEDLWRDINSIIGNNILIFLFTNLDKRTAFYKHYKDSIVEFETLKPEILRKYIQREIELSDENCNQLIEICESDYSRILLEIDKIRIFQSTLKKEQSGRQDYNFAFTELLNQGVIYQPPKDAIFEFIDVLLKAQPDKAFNLLEQSYAVGESTIVLLSVLYNNVRQVLQVQACENSDISKSTGLTGWQIKCAKENCGYYSTGDLVYLLRLIQQVEEGIKTGKMEESIAMSYIMVNLWAD